jgi:hypothetical protein
MSRASCSTASRWLSDESRACLLPRIEAETRQGRDHAQRNSIDLVADRSEQKFVQIGPQGAEERAQCHRAGTGVRSARSCREAMLISS